MWLSEWLVWYAKCYTSYKVLIPIRGDTKSTINMLPTTGWLNIFFKNTCWYYYYFNMFGIIKINTLLKFKSWPLKNDSWKTTFLFWPISRRYNFQGVSFNYIQFIHSIFFFRGFYITALFCLRSLLIILMVLVLPLFQLVGSQSNGWRFLGRH